MFNLLAAKKKRQNDPEKDGISNVVARCVSRYPQIRRVCLVDGSDDDTLELIAYSSSEFGEHDISAMENNISEAIGKQARMTACPKYTSRADSCQDGIEVYALI